MALTSTQQHNFVVGDRRETSFDISLNTYATGGVAYTPQKFGLAAKVDILQVSPKAGYVFETDYANKKIVAYQQKDPANAGGADIPLVEVADTTDLSGVTTRARAVGK